MHTGSIGSRLELLVLAALGPGARGGSGLLGEIRRRGASPRPAAIFEAVRRLERAGLVATPGPGAGAYRLTPAGRARLARERAAWVGLARTVATALDRAA